MMRPSLARLTMIVAGAFLFGCGGVEMAPDGGGGAGGASAGAGGRGGAAGGVGRGGTGGPGGAAGTGGVAGAAGGGGAGGAAGTGGSAGAGGATGGAAGTGTGGSAGAAGRGGSGGATGGSGGATGGSGGATGGRGGAGGSGGGGSGGSGGSAGGTGGATGGTGGSAGGTGGATGGTGGSGGSAGAGGATGGAAGTGTAGTGGTAGSGPGGGGTGGGTAGTGGTGGNVAAPSITATSYAVVAHGMDLVVTGARFTGVTAMTIGGLAHTPTITSDTQMTVRVLDTTPRGAQSIVLTNAGGASLPFGVTVIHLIINELDPDTASNDVAEFVELSTGVAGVSLAGYTLVFWNGANDSAYFTIELNGTTNAAGFLMVGNAGVVPAPALTFPDNTLQNGADAVGVYAAGPSSYPVGSLVTATRLIDAVVYDSGDPDDVGLLDVLLGDSQGRVQVDEDANASSDTQSIQRCGTARLRGDQFALGTPTAASANNPCTTN